MVNALAGTGKTSTIEMVCHAVKNIPILYLAFNKRIVDEAAKRMPSHVECRTQNGLGHRVWAQATGKRLIVDSGKMRQILKNLISELPRKDQGEAWEDFQRHPQMDQQGKARRLCPRLMDGALQDQ
jgi:hypothetical protein